MCANICMNTHEWVCLQCGHTYMSVKVCLAVCVHVCVHADMPAVCACVCLHKQVCSLRLGNAWSHQSVTRYIPVCAHMCACVGMAMACTCVCISVCVFTDLKFKILHLALGQF